jgi:hypothetical protein
MFLKCPNVDPSFVALQSGTMQDQRPPFMYLFGDNRHGWLGDVTVQPQSG